MSYVFDNSPLSVLFKNYYPETFPTLWMHFNQLVKEGRLVSTREVLREINDSSIERLREWAKQNHELFSTPTPQEGYIVAQIFKVNHFQQNIELQKIMNGGKNADPFVIAKAKVDGFAVVTTEVFKDHGVKIPNICRHFDVECLTLQQFMEREGWVF